MPETLLNPWITESVNRTRQLLNDPAFCHQHRTKDQYFTRQRHFTFVNTVLFLLQKTVRSIQLHIHSFFEALGHACPGLTPSAWSQARLKLRSTAFITLHDQAVVRVVYQDPAHPRLKLWKGHRLDVIDSSLQRLPNDPALGEEFGWVESRNQQGDCGRHPQARLSVLTDVLNKIPRHTLFEPWKRGERELALEHLKHLEPWDLALMDRGFAEYVLWAHFVKAQRKFVCRCQASSFAVVNQLFAEDQAGRSVVVDLEAPRGQLAEVRQAGLPEMIRLRLVTVRLSTGELEVLASYGLEDETLYPTECFGELYHYRWGEETYYFELKSRLNVGHFTGLSPEAVRQDVYATVFLSGLEAILIGPANQELAQHSATLKHPQQVNHAVSFHTIKSYLLALLGSSEPLEQLLPKLHRLFLDNPTTIRPQRYTPRNKPSAWTSLYFQRSVCKAVY